MTITETLLDGSSGNALDWKIEALRELFPEAFADGKPDVHKLALLVDPDHEPWKERYGLNWPGKAECVRTIRPPSYATLKPTKDESVDWDTTENLFVEGDNLEVLKLLQKSYYGKVKMIYIDPPYNTGNDFIYPDNYSESLETYLKYTGQVGEEGLKASTNQESDGRFHSKWLNMMWPRLYLARNLLREDGAIFVSIDDNEAANLRMLMDEIFGEDNFVAQVVWERAFSPVNLKHHFSECHDYLLCYAKDVSQLDSFALKRSEGANDRYKNPDNDRRGPWASSDFSVGPAVESNIYEITTPSGRKVLPPSGYSWRFSQDRMRELAEDSRIWFGEDGGNVPRLKRFLSDVKDGVTPMTLWKYKEVGSSQDATKEVKELFDGKALFNYPKPVGLISRVLEVSTADDDIILDFFAGSGTTAHAVMALNAEDGWNRKFLSVQLPEPTEPDSEAAKAGYATIADITKDRIRRAASKLNDVDGNDKAQDRWFRVMKLVPSNFKRWKELPPDSAEDQISLQLELHADNVDATASDDDLLSEILLKAGISPTEKVRIIEIAWVSVRSVADGLILVSLAREITKELIDAVAAAEPARFYCLDSAFGGNDQLKANAVQAFAARNQGRENVGAIEFRTV